MRFESRELTLSSEPVKTAALVEGETYFSVNYVDQDKLIPILQPYVFKGRGLSSGDLECLYFQCLDPVRRGVDDDPSRWNGADLLLALDAQPHLFDYEQALNELMICSLKRRGVDFNTQPLRFEISELQRFPDPVRGEDLQEDEIYFSVFFVDEDFLVPGLEPYVFIGRDIDIEEPGLYFQDMDSYRRGVRYGADAGDKRATLVVDSDRNLNHFEYEKALEQLLVCSVRRRAEKGA